METKMTRVTWILILIFMMMAAGMNQACCAEERSGDKRIVGGSETDPGRYPWIAVLARPDIPLEQGQFCAGALIHEKWILTAAHCLYETSRRVIQTDDVEAILGVHDLVAVEGERFAVKNMIIHPDYSYFKDDYDFALLELSGNARNYAAVALYEGDGDLTGKTSTVFGWGEQGDGSYSDVLMEVQVDIVSNTACNEAFNLDGGYGLDPVTQSMLCAGAPGRDSCFGDSGGPLVIQNDNHDIYLAGVVSWGPDQCADDGLYGVYGRVSQALDFIRGYAPINRFPDISVTPENITFAPTVVDQTDLQKITIVNLGEADLEIGRLYFSASGENQFQIVNDACSDRLIPVSQACHVELAFTPAAAGEWSGQLTIPSNDPDAFSVSVSFAGQGVSDNQAPVAAAGDDQTVTEGDRVELEGSESYDPDQHQITFEWRQTSGVHVSLSDPTDARPSFTAPEAESGVQIIEFELLVKDEFGLQGSDGVSITIRPNTSPPDVREGENAPQIGGSGGGCFVGAILPALKRQGPEK